MSQVLHCDTTSAKPDIHTQKARCQASRH